MYNLEKHTHTISSSDTGKDDNLLFLTLETIHRIEINDIQDTVAKSLLESRLELTHLLFVRSDHTNLTGKLDCRQLGAKHVDQSNCSVCLCHVEDGFASSQFFLAIHDIEESIRRELRECMPDGRGYFIHVGAVFELRLIEHFAGEAADVRVHTVLDTRRGIVSL